MLVFIEWFTNTRKRPVPNVYPCTVSCGENLKSAVIYFSDDIRHTGLLEFLVDNQHIQPEMYITEGSKIVGIARHG